MKYRVMSWIPIEPDDEIEPYDDFKEAKADYEQAQMLQPENRYELQVQDDNSDWHTIEEYEGESEMGLGLELVAIPHDGTTEGDSNFSVKLFVEVGSGNPEQLVKALTEKYTTPDEEGVRAYDPEDFQEWIAKELTGWWILTKEQHNLISAGLTDLCYDSAIYTASETCKIQAEHADSLNRKKEWYPTMS